MVSNTERFCKESTSKDSKTLLFVKVSNLFSFSFGKYMCLSFCLHALLLKSRYVYIHLTHKRYAKILVSLRRWSLLYYKTLTDGC